MLHGVSGNICCLVSLEPNYVNKAVAGELLLPSVVASQSWLVTQEILLHLPQD